MKLPTLRTVGAAGLVYGAIVYGAPIAILHLLHNQVATVRDGVLTWAASLLLYGAWGAATFLGATALLAAWGLLRRRRFEWPAAGSAARLGVLVLNLVFWELFVLYGRTYEETFWATPPGRAGMVVFLLGCALGVALVVGLVSWVFCRLAAVASRRIGLRPAALVATGLSLVAALSAVAMAPAPAAVPAAPAVPPRAVDTGVNVVLVGLDGADFRVIDPLIAAGELPAFAALRETGASGPLATLPDSNSAVIWATMYSGLPPETHGIEDFYRVELPGMRGPGLYPVHRSFFKELANLVEPLGLLSRTLVTRYSLDGVMLWEIADRLGLSIGVVDGYLGSFPAYGPTTPGGYFLAYGADAYAASMATRSSEDAKFFVQPPQLFREVRENLTGGDFHWQAKSLLGLLGTHPQPRFVNLYTHEPDTVQHQQWKWYQPELYLGVSAAKVAAKQDAIPALHREFDAFLAKLRERVGPEAVIVVTSDHGHVPTIVHELYTQHRHGPPGILMLAGGPVRAGFELEGADVYDLAPTLLYLLGLPVPEDLPGRVLSEALDPGFTARFPVRTTPTYRYLDPLAGTTAGPRDRDRDRLEIEKLKSLGYI